MTKIKSVLGKIFLALFAAIFLWLSWLCLNESQIAPLYTNIVLSIGVNEILLGLLVFWVCRLLGKLVKHKSLISAIIIVAIFAVYFYFQFITASHFYSQRGTSWDFNVVAGAAMDYVEKGEQAGKYFRMWPNNTPLFMLLVAVFKPFAALGADLNLVGIALNILAIDAAFILAALVIRKITNSRAAGFVGLMIHILSLPFLLYVTIYYTDTLTLPFPVLTLYLWLAARDSMRQDKKLSAILLMAAMGLAAALGGTLKLTAMFMLIAAAVDAFLNLPLKKAAAGFAAALVIFAVVSAAFSAFNNNTTMIVEDNEEYYIPKLHWVMMGLRGKGNYYDPDYRLTLSVPGAERDELCKTEIINRIKEMGFGGMLEHLHQKCAFVWAEGTYYSSLKLARDRATTSIFDKYVIYTEPEFTYLAHYCQSLELVNLILMAIAAIRMLFTKHEDNPMFVCCVGVFGMFLFECLWEARSRYIFNFLPVMIIIAVVQTVDLAKWIGKIFKKKEEEK